MSKLPEGTKTVKFDKEEKKSSKNSIHLAAQCWCDEETREIEFDSRLATAFAKRLDSVLAIERHRVLMLILKDQTHMTSDYRETVRHTGGLLTKSMAAAYSRGIHDVLLLLTKTNKGLEDAEKAAEEKQNPEPSNPA